MAFGLSPSDCERGIRLALEIWEAFFVRANRAELRYKEFGGEIRSLERALRRLVDIFVIAAREREERIFPSDVRALDSAVDQERRDLVGDFEATLVRCRELLAENVRLAGRGSNVWDNAKWHFATQGTIDLLRARLQSHTAKAVLVIQPLQCQLLHEISGNVWDIRHDVRALRDEVRLAIANREVSDQPVSQDETSLPQIPSVLNDLFLEAVEVRAPSSYTGVQNFPLSSGLDALIYHFRESTVKFSDGEFGGVATPTVEQLLNLAKAVWILGKLQESSNLREAGASSLWARSLRICEARILEQFRRPAIGRDVFERESQNLSQLGKENFGLWQPLEPLQAPKTITDEDSGEEKILEVSLQESHGTLKKTLILFRQALNEYRLVRITVPEAEGYAPQPDERIINTHAFRVSPHYLLPTAAPSMSCHISGPFVHRGDFYDFKSLADIFAVQHALTGYKVVQHSTKINWTTCHSGLFRTRQEFGTGTIQIWRSKPMHRLTSGQPNTPGAQPVIRTRSIPDSRSSIVTSSTAESILNRFGGSAASVLSGSSDGGQVIAGSMPRDPVLIIFTRWQSKLAFLHLQLDDQIEMRREPCQCTAAGHTCCEVVLSKPKRRKFRIRSHTAQTDKDGNDILPTWNLSVLGLPRHPDFSKLEKADDVVWLNLHFPSVQARGAFETAFNTASALREVEQGEFRKLSMALEWRSQKQPLDFRDTRSSLGLTPRSTRVRTV